jgi:hypothetical protein
MRVLTGALMVINDPVIVLNDPLMVVNALMMVVNDLVIMLNVSLTVVNALMMVVNGPVTMLNGPLRTLNGLMMVVNGSMTMLNASLTVVTAVSSAAGSLVVRFFLFIPVAQPWAAIRREGRKADRMRWIRSLSFLPQRPECLDQLSFLSDQTAGPGASAPRAGVHSPSHPRRPERKRECGAGEGVGRWVGIRALDKQWMK